MVSKAEVAAKCLLEIGQFNLADASLGNKSGHNSAQFLQNLVEEGEIPLRSNVQKKRKKIGGWGLDHAFRAFGKGRFEAFCALYEDRHLGQNRGHPTIPYCK